jgi:signal transduction histidine kinase
MVHTPSVSPRQWAGGLEKKIAALKHGDHLCMIYENRDQQMRAVIPFIVEGLHQGDRCVYIADEQSVQEVAHGLGEAGVEVEKELERGALSLLTKRESYLRNGSFDPKEMLEFLENEVEVALEDGFRGFRVTGEMTWALGEDVDELIRYEALMNRFYPGSKAMALCQYNRFRFPARVIHDVLKTHPKAVLGEEVCTNLYYEPPELVLEGQHDDERVDWMISKLQRWHRMSVSREELKQEVEERRRVEAVLRRMTAALERSNEELEQFAYVASHDLREPLRTIAGYMELLERRYGAELDETATHYIQRTVAGTKRMQRLIQDLLEYSRVQTQGGAFEEVDLGELVKEVLGSLERMIEERGVQVNVGPLPVVQADPSQMERVFANLLTNAIKYAPEDRTPVVSVFAVEEDGAWQVCVEDNGMGIPEGEYEQVFALSRRLVPREPDDPGTGMGLSIAERIIKRHGGRIWVESVEGEGSVFRFTIPKGAGGA